MPKRKRVASKAAKDDEKVEEEGREIVGGLKDPTGNTRSSGSTTNDTDQITHLKIPYESKQIVCEKYHSSSTKTSDDGSLSLVFTHGAGGGIENPATKSFVTGFASIAPEDAICFQGTMNLSHRTKTFHAVLADQGRARALGGRSMGARAAVLTATQCTNETTPDTVVLVSYPLTAPGGNKPGKGEERKQILLDLPAEIDVLFVIGSKDAMCDIDALGEVRRQMSARNWLMEVKGADHGMSFTPKAGVDAVRVRTGALAAEWLQNRNEKARYCSVEWSKEDRDVVFSGWTAEEADQKPSKKRKK